VTRFESLECDNVRKLNLKKTRPKSTAEFRDEISNPQWSLSAPRIKALSKGYFMRFEKLKELRIL
jgi:hypothetical protein